MHTGNLEYYHLLEREPYESRGSRTVLMGTQGEVPWVYLLMSELNIPADRVIQHYDVCAKNCPSTIRAKNDWNRFKKLIQEKEEENSPSGGKKITLTEELRVILPELSRGCTGTAVKMLQVFLQVQTDGIFGTETENALRTFQKNTNQSADGICGKNSWTAIAVHMRENTYAGY